MSRRAQYLITGLVSLLIILAVAWFWLLHTQSGARFLWTKARQIAPGELQAAGVDGSLSTGLVVSGLRYSNADTIFSINETHLTLDVDLLPLSVEISSLFAQSVDMRLSGSPSSIDERRIDVAGIFETLRLPIPVYISDFQLNDFSLAQAESAPEQLISSLDLVAELGNKLVVEQLRLQSPFGAAEINGSIDLKGLYPTRINGEISIDNVGVTDLNGMSISATVEGDMRRLELEVQSLLPSLLISGNVSDILSEPVYDIRIRSQKLGWPFRSDAPGWLANDLDIGLVGTIDAYDIEANASLVQTVLGAADVSVVGTGSTRAIKIENATARSGWIDASTSGELDWSDQLSVTFDSNVARFDLSEYLSVWPEANSLSGIVAGRWQGLDIELSNLALAVAGTEIEVSGAGNINARDRTIDGSLLWRRFQWPLAAANPIFSSDVGDVLLTGTLSSWVVDGVSTAKFRDLPEGRLNLHALGDQDGVAITVPESFVFGGSVLGKGSYSWRDERRYTSNLTLNKIQTGAFLPEWPGIISGDVTMEGRQLSSAVRMEFNDLQGELRAAPFSVDGSLSLSTDNISAAKLSLIHGDSRLSLDGSPMSRSGISYRINVPNINDYLRDAVGSLEGFGVISLDDTRPKVRANLSARNIVYRDLEIVSADIREVANAADDLFVSQEIVVNGLSVAGTSTEKILVTAVGHVEDHELVVDAQAGDYSLSAEAAGSVSNWRRLDKATWSGELRELQAGYLDTLQVELQSPVALLVSGSRMALDRGCLIAANEPALCVEADWERDASISMSADVQDLPLEWLNRFLGSDLVFSQTLSGRLQVDDRAGQAAELSVNVDLSAGQVTSTYDENLSFETGVGVLAFRANDYGLGAGKFDMAFPGIGDIDLDFEVNDVSSAGNSPISGKLQIDLSNISPLARLFPYFESEGGRLVTDVGLGGTVTKPIVNGQFSLTDASVHYSPLGTRLNNLDIEASITGNNRLDMDASFVAGTGVGRITTSAAYESGDTTNIELEVRGNDILLVDMPEIRVVADPDFRLGIRNRSIRIDGQVNIPEAHLRPTALPQGQVVESGDVVVVAGDIPLDDQVENSDQALSVNGELTVTLGKSVTIDLDVATATLGGSVRFAWQDDVMPTANGAYTVNGTVSALGQVLEISKGAIRYPSVSADNPYLNIAAEREIFGNTQVKTAGILVTGSAKNPVVEAYTYPLTTEERALTLLATGSDFDYEQGVGALDFGTYIAPRLFLSYGIGVFERDNIISARYDIKGGLGIKASSGQRESGVDLIYRVDK